MRQAAPQRYLETQILTASREQLLLMLYDGALRFCDQGREALQAKAFEQAHEALIRAQRIVIELWCALNPDVSPDLGKSLGGLYSFAYLRLVHANVHHEAAAIDEAIGVLRTLREAWGEAVARTAETPQATASSLQING